MKVSNTVSKSDNANNKTISKREKTIIEIGKLTKDLSKELNLNKKQEKILVKLIKKILQLQFIMTGRDIHE